MFVTLTLGPAIDCTLAVEGALAFGGAHKVRSETRTPGGKGINVAKMLAANRQTAWACGILGRAEREFYRSFLDHAGIQSEFLTVPHPTRRNIMAVDDNGKEIKFNRPAFPDLEFDWEQLRGYCAHIAGMGSVVIMSGSLPPRFPADTYARLTTLFNNAGKTVVLDTGGEPLRIGMSAGPAVIKPNRDELREALGREMRTREEIVSTLRDISMRHRAVILSDGRHGGYFVAGETIFYGSAPEVRVVDTTGAGDSLLGQFCCDYFASAGRELNEQVVANALAAGSACVELHGTPLLSSDRVKALASLVRVERL